MGWGTPWRIHVGVHGGPLNFPYLVSAQKDLSVGFLIFFSTPNIKAVMPVFAPKSAVLRLHHICSSDTVSPGYIIIRGGTKSNKRTQNAGKCTILHEDFKKFTGVTPRTPSGAGRKCPAYSGLWTGNNGKCYNSRESPYFRLIFVEHTY